MTHTEHFTFNAFQVRCSLMWDSKGYCAIVDPGYSQDAEKDRIVAFIESNKLKPVCILLTHAHFDHILDIDEWVRETGATVIISESEASALSDPMRNCYKLFNGSDRGYFGEAVGIKDGDTLTLGDATITFMHTPGHTSGSGIYITEGSAFVGDTVFAGGGYGRCDLPTGNGVILRDSIRRLLTLPDGTLLYPGHGEPTTVRQYKLDIK